MYARTPAICTSKADQEVRCHSCVEFKVEEFFVAGVHCQVASVFCNFVGISVVPKSKRFVRVCIAAFVI